MNETLLKHAEAFLAHKHALGYLYQRQEEHLRTYLKFMEKKFPDVTFPNQKSTQEFLSLYKGQRGCLYNVIAVLREFARYLLSIGIDSCYLIASKQLPKLNPAPPYFFSKSEMETFFTRCDAFCEEQPQKINRKTFCAAMRLMYCCGVRFKEARCLERSNVNFEQKFIDVIQSKGPKNRRIFISSDLCNYLRHYDNCMALALPARRYFFAKNQNDAFSNGFYYGNFQTLWKQAFPNWGEQLFPRIYDFRHHFAWYNINRWYREGKDINAMLPYLSRYMGHNCIKHTLYYFRFVPDFYPDYIQLADKIDQNLMKELIDA